MKKFIALVEAARAHQGLARLGILNRSVNELILPQSDLQHWGKLDVWSPPLTTLEEGRGDCEDYAILKRAILRSLGEEVRVAVVFRNPTSIASLLGSVQIKAWDERIVIRTWGSDIAIVHEAPPESHFVAEVKFGSRWLVLDNLQLLLLEMSQIKSYRRFDTFQ